MKPYDDMVNRKSAALWLALGAVLLFISLSTIKINYLTHEISDRDLRIEKLERVNDELSNTIKGYKEKVDKVFTPRIINKIGKHLPKDYALLVIDDSIIVITYLGDSRDLSAVQDKFDGIKLKVVEEMHHSNLRITGLSYNFYGTQLMMQFENYPYKER